MEITPWLDDLVNDLRYTVRSLTRHKAFAATAVSTLALGIGVTTAVFSVVNGVVLRRLPFAQPDRLVQMYGTSPLVPRGDAVSNLEEFRTQSSAFDALVGYEVSAGYLRDARGADRVLTVRTERGFFSMLGVAPIRGRTFRADDPPTVAVVGEEFWKRRLGGDSSIVGLALTLDDKPLTIIGVMPEAFQFPYGAASLLPGVAAETRSDLWIPLDPPLRPRSRIRLVTGRLKQTTSLPAAEQELAAIARRMESQYPETNTRRGVYLVPLSDAVVGASVRRPLFVLLCAAGLVLLLVCANVTNLSLVRMTLRQREVALRSALGAGPLRLVRQFLTESLLLSLVAGALGLVLAWWGTSWMMLVASAQIPRAHEAGLDWRVFIFLLAVCAVTAVATGIAPALVTMRRDAQSALQQSGGQSTMGSGQRRVRDAILVAEIALAFVLAMGATLLIREHARLKNTYVGMETRNVVTFHLGHRMISRGRERPSADDVRQFYEIADRVARLPGVQAAGFTQLLPLQNWGWTSNSSDFRARGRAPQSIQFPIELRFVTPGYFRALGIPLHTGRAFTADDDRDARGVILINETLARRYFGGEDPVGQDTNRGTIVGVVGDVRQANIEESASPEIYFPMAQNWSQLSELGMTLVVSARDRPEPLVDAVRSVIRSVNPNLAVFNVKTMERVIADWLSRFIIFLWLIAVFAALALLLASTGTYGVISYVASSRTREYAIRIALGADRGRVTRLILGEGLRLTVIGLSIGLSLGFAVAPLLRVMPVLVRPPDVTTSLPPAIFIALIALASCLVPARRASAVDPMSTLRNE
jgi:putative ABC transport system permease protein